MKRSFTKAMICCLLVVVIVLTAGCELFDRTSGPQKALANFEKAINEGNIEGIFEIFTPHQQAELNMALESVKMMANMFGSMMDIDGLGDMFSAEMLSGMLGIAMDGNYVTIEVLEEVYSDDGTTADVTIRLISGQENITETVKMIEISDQWYLDESVTGDIAGNLFSDMGFGF